MEKLLIVQIIAAHVATRLAMSSAPIDPAGQSQQIKDAICEGCQIANDLVYWADKQHAAWSAAGGPLAVPTSPTPTPVAAVKASAPAVPGAVLPPVLGVILGAAQGAAAAAGI